MYDMVCVLCMGCPTFRLASMNLSALVHLLSLLSVSLTVKLLTLSPSMGKGNWNALGRPGGRGREGERDEGVA